MAFVDNLEYLNLNSLRAYPLKEGTTRKSVDGYFSIPDTFIVDASFAVDADVATRLYIKNIVNNANTISIEIYKNGVGSIGNFSIPISSHTKYKEYYLTPNAAFPLASGKICVNDLSAIGLQPSGTFTFDLGQAEFESRVVIPSVSNITKLTFINHDNSVVVSLSGDVVIQARTNLKFRTETTGDITRVILDAGNGIGLNQSCASTLPCIKTINRIGPENSGDHIGNFTISGEECSGITSTTNGIILNETCCKPCVGCDEVGTLTDRLISVEADLLKLKDYYTQLNLLSQQIHSLIGFSCDCPSP